MGIFLLFIIIIIILACIGKSNANQNTYKSLIKESNELRKEIEAIIKDDIQSKVSMYWFSVNWTNAFHD